MTSMTGPFSACIMISPPFFRVCCSARKMWSSGLRKTPGYAVNSLKSGIPSSTSWSISARLAAFTSLTIMWKP